MKTLDSTSDLADIRNRVALLTPTDSAQWGSMSAHQAICHLTDAFCCPLGERVPPPVKPPIPLPMLKWLALSFPMKWPKGVPTPPLMDQQVGGTAPGDFTADLATLLAKLEQFVRTEDLPGPHPMFGVMTRHEWMRWGYLHSD